jgi:hypothetical protein
MSRRVKLRPLNFWPEAEATRWGLMLLSTSLVAGA